MPKDEFAGHESEARKTSGPAAGSAGKVVGFGQNWDFMCNLLLQSSDLNFTKVLQSLFLAYALASLLLDWAILSI